MNSHFKVRDRDSDDSWAAVTLDLTLQASSLDDFISFVVSLGLAIQMDSHRDVSTDNRIEGSILNTVVFASSSQVQVAIPAEVLGWIVELTLPEPLPGHIVGLYNPEICSSHRTWRLLNLSHVTRYWRAVIVSHASLWSFIEGPRNTGDSNTIQLCMERSKNVPLRMTNFCYPRSAPSLLRESRRLLECLLLSTSTSYLTHNLPDIISGFPRLRRLWLERFISWPKCQFSCLTHLALSGVTGGKRLSMVEFLDVLRENTGLQVLVLDKVYFILERAERPVEVPHLRYLVINDRYDSVIRDVIPALILPSPMTARFHTCLPPDGQVLLANTHAKSFFTDDTTISVIAWSRIKLNYFFDNLDYKFEVLPDLPFDTSADFSLGLPLPVEDPWRIRELSIEIPSDATRLTRWIDLVFRSTPGLTKLTISANSTSNCVLWFIAILRGALPELKTLCVHLRDATTGPIRFSPLLRLVRQRHVDGRPLKNVVIHDERLKGPNLYTKTLRGIVSYVDTLEWDSSPSPFKNSNTGFVYASIPDDLRSWNWQDEFR
ncbi:hypothetical protein EW146_g8555 [Bondarzewia mesenterica]|uniref:F-box domain-containing protein n=1 Tax=Bondarzewia mesenterica TaxID=1095465 RepID=A0A4S4LDQ1_9AGAM|nr:hypothetical protein EW146_g8555 [Bondarzewia mesenterica]